MFLKGSYKGVGGVLVGCVGGGGEGCGGPACRHWAGGYANPYREKVTILIEFSSQ